MVVEGDTLVTLAAFDFDHDGDRDALWVTTGEGPTARPRLQFAMRQGERFGPSIELAAATTHLGCIAERADIAIEPDHAMFVRAEIRCEGGPRWIVAWVLGEGASLRVVERFALRAETGDVLSLRAEDRDGDERADIVADITLGSGSETVTVPLSFLRRSSGFARDPAEPESSISALAENARAVLRRDPQSARRIAQRAMLLFDGVCREGSAPRVELGQTTGLVCGRSEAMGAAVAAYVAAAARGGDSVAAVAAWSRLADPAMVVRERDRAVARAALEAPVDAGVTIHEGPVVAVPRAPLPRLSALAFLDEHRVRIRVESESSIVDLESGEVISDEAIASLAVVDPGGRFRVSAMERDCNGTRLRIVAVDPGIGSVSVLAPLALTAESSGAGVTCSTGPARAIPWVVLGWSPQGVLAARNDELRIVPLDVDAAPVGPPRTLDSDDPVPAPIVSGHATADGRAYVRSTEFGIVLVEFAPRRTTWVRPAGFVAPQGTEIDVAVSPTTERVAWIAGNHLRWIDRLTTSGSTATDRRR